MKLLYIRLSGILLLAGLFLCNLSFAQSDATYLSEGYYVVVGAYSVNKEAYAKRFVDIANERGYEAKYGLNNRGSMYFVYTYNTAGDYQKAIRTMREMRTKNGFEETWVYVMLDRGSEVKETPPPAEPAIKEVIKDQPSNEVDGSDEEVIPENTPVDAESEIKQEITDKEEAKLEQVIEKEEAGGIFQINNLGDATTFINLVNSRNGKDVTGEVQIIDLERSKLIGTKVGGEYLAIDDPKNGTGRLLFVADIFGFRKEQLEVNYYNPLPDTAKANVDLLADIYLITFDLIRYHAGDIVTMYNVYFYKDAAIMRPQSKFEVQSLLTMMQENPDYRIRIHGHVNGNHPGRIVTMGEGKNNYFALATTDVDGFGSAKELSLKRAEIIRDYLVEHGIAPDRMEIKAWGGKKMIHDKHSSRADENVRVEIEILEE